MTRVRDQRRPLSGSHVDPMKNVRREVRARVYRVIGACQPLGPRCSVVTPAWWPLFSPGSPTAAVGLSSRATPTASATAWAPAEFLRPSLIPIVPPTRPGQPQIHAHRKVHEPRHVLLVSTRISDLCSSGLTPCEQPSTLGHVYTIEVGHLSVEV